MDTAMGPRKAADIVTLEEERRRRKKPSDDGSSHDHLPEAGASDHQFQKDQEDKERQSFENVEPSGSTEVDEKESDILAADTFKGDPTALASTAPVPPHQGEDPANQELETAGDMLTAARLASGLSLEEVEKLTNIRQDRLVAMEAMDVTALPSAPYTLGFVRTYAELLELPAEAMMARFRKDAGYGEAPKQVKIAPPPPKNVSAPAQISFLAVLGVIAFMVWVIWQIIQATAPDEVVTAQGVPLATPPQGPVVVPYEMETSLEDEVQIVPDSLSDAFPALVDSVSADGPAVGDGAISDEAQTGLTDGIAATPLMTPTDLIDEEGAVTDLTEATGQESEGVSAQEKSLSLSAAEQLNQAAVAQLEQDRTPATPQDRGEEAIVTAEGALSPPQASAQTLAPAQGVVAQPAPIALEGGAERTDPIVRLAVEPVYPARCESTASSQETITLGFTVSRYGKVVNPEVTSSTNSCFDGAALAAIARWDFVPAQENGRAVASNRRQTRVIFELP
ncbi:MAG: TonB family protein [Pseudomonadota bacterium]